MASAILIVALVGGTAVAQTPARLVAATSHGRVLGVFDEDTGQPVDGVRVTDIVTGTFATTTNTGTVALNFLADSGSLVRVQKIGYQSQTMVVAVSPADTSPITLVLKRITELPASLTTADSAPHYLSNALRGFEQRRLAGMGGYFIGEKELRKLENSTLGTVARRLPGARVLDGADAAYLMPSVRCLDGRTVGPPAVYVDGIEWAPTLRPDAPRLLGRDVTGVAINLNELQVSDLAGIEYYPDNDQAPIGFSHTAKRCGALYLWTRER